MSLWLDYSFARPSLLQILNDKVTGVLRYVCPDTPVTHGKILFAAELHDLLAIGVDVALNYEWYEGRCNEGGPSGAQDGRTALAMGKALGYPSGSIIYFSHDTGLYNYPNIEAYFREAKSAVGGYYQIGAYGSYELIQHLHTLGLISRGWQTTAWSAGRRDDWAVLYQDGRQLYNGAVDVDQVSGDVGGWHSNGGGLVSAEYDALAQKIDHLGGVLVNSPDHAGHLQLLAGLQNLANKVNQNDTALATALAAVATSLERINGRLDLLEQPVGASAKDIVTELGAAISKGEVS